MAQETPPNPDRDPGDAVPPGVAPAQPAPPPTPEDETVREKLRQLPETGATEADAPASSPDVDGVTDGNRGRPERVGTVPSPNPGDR